VIYLALIMGIVLFIFVALALRATGRHQSLYLRRARNLFVAGGFVALIALPLLFLARHYIFDYYIVGHIIGEEKYIRARELGLHSIIDHVIYYPVSVWTHLGAASRWMMAAVAVIAIVNAIHVRRSLRGYFLRLLPYRFELLVVALSIVIPLAVLTADISKSPVVGSIVLVPLILFLVLLCAPIWPQRLLPQGRTAKTGSVMRNVHFGRLYAALLALAALVVVAKRGPANQHYFPRDDLSRITSINEAIGRYVIDNGMHKPTVSFDRVAEYLNWGTLRLFTYERFGRLVDYDPLFGHGGYGIFATPRETAMQLVMKSDIIIITDPKIDREAPYPMNTKIQEYWGEIYAWAGAHRNLLLSSHILNMPVHVYVIAPK
jgi:hypothetical protein